MHDDHSDFGCGCGCDRRDFLGAVGTALGGLALTSLNADGAEDAADAPAKKQGATVRVAFVYPPSKTLADNPNAWWSWPGNDFDAEGRQKQYLAALHEIENKLGVNVVTEETTIATKADAERLAKEIEGNRPDGLLLILFHGPSRPLADHVIKAAETLAIPVVFFIGLGVVHGSVKHYRRAGLYFIQSLDNLDAIEYGLRMIQAKKRMSQSRILSITEAPIPSDKTEPFFGLTIRSIPFARYAEQFQKVVIGDEAREWIAGVTGGAKEIRNVSNEALDNAARAHFALKKLLADESGDAVAMKCLQRGMLKPCVSFSSLNGALTPAACQKDLQSACTQLLGKLLVGRPGFIHNICYETEGNRFYASHCTCATKLHGPDGPDSPYLLRRFAHSNEGSCAIQVFWKDGDPVTMAQYYPGDPATLDVYGGKVFKSHDMPPAGGYTTNVDIEITDLADACSVGGGDWHNVLFCGDFARKFRLFANLFKMKLADNGLEELRPI